MADRGGKPHHGRRGTPSWIFLAAQNRGAARA
jgi:hypothetical protein